LELKNLLIMISRLIIILLCVVLSSCGKMNREKIVDKTELTGDDYRLFQGTPVWELAKAVWDEDVSRIDKIVSKNKQLINFQEPIFGRTLLILTISNQQYKSFEALIEQRADISIHDTYSGTSALIEACSFKQYEIKFVELLLESGANVNDIETGERKEWNTTRFTPLIAAAKTGMLDLVELLIRNGADINYQNEYKHSALSESIMVSRYEIALYLLKEGADYKQPIFFKEEQNRDMYLVDVLREDFFDLDTDKYKYKMGIVDFLKSKSINYKATPIPEYIKKKAQENYPDNWQEYLEKY